MPSWKRRSLRHGLSLSRVNSSVPIGAPGCAPPFAARIAASGRPARPSSISSTSDGAWTLALKRCCALNRLGARGAGPLIFLDLGLHIRQPGGEFAIGAEVEHREQAEATGTREATILAGSRETVSGGRDHGGGGVQCAGARASQAEIGLMRR